MRARVKRRWKKGRVGTVSPLIKRGFALTVGEPLNTTWVMYILVYSILVQYYRARYRVYVFLSPLVQAMAIDYIKATVIC